MLCFLSIVVIRYAMIHRILDLNFEQRECYDTFPDHYILICFILILFVLNGYINMVYF